MLSSSCAILSVLMPLLVVRLDICHCQDRMSEGIEDGTMKSNQATIHNRGVRLSLKRMTHLNEIKSIFPLPDKRCKYEFKQFYYCIDHVYLMERDYLYILRMMLMEDTTTVEHLKKGRYLLEKEEEVLLFIEMEMYILVNIPEKKMQRAYRREEAA